MTEVQAALAVDHLPLVQTIARRFARHVPLHVERDELVSAGALGLVDAAGRFDAGRGVQFKSFATWRVRGAILDAMRLDDGLSRRQRATLGRAMVTVQLDATHERLPWTPAEDVEAELAEYRRLLLPWIAELPPRDAYILRRYLVDGVRQDIIAREVRLGPTRISQIVTAAAARFQAKAAQR